MNPAHPSYALSDLRLGLITETGKLLYRQHCGFSGILWLEEYILVFSVTHRAKSLITIGACGTTFPSSSPTTARSSLDLGYLSSHHLRIVPHLPSPFISRSLPYFHSVVMF